MLFLCSFDFSVGIRAFVIDWVISRPPSLRVLVCVVKLTLLAQSIGLSRSRLTAYGSSLGCETKSHYAIEGSSLWRNDKMVPVGVWTGTFKEPHEMSMVWGGPNRRSTFFRLSAHLCEVTNTPEISLNVTVRSQFINQNNSFTNFSTNLSIICLWQFL